MQKTAYEMRISDWSSDVCSSDLPRPPTPEKVTVQPKLSPKAEGKAATSPESAPDDRGCSISSPSPALCQWPLIARLPLHRGFSAPLASPKSKGATSKLKLGSTFIIGCDAAWQVQRSEEHTSELQSLMRISYAVFCLKKKNYKKST